MLFPRWKKKGGNYFILEHIGLNTKYVLGWFSLLECNRVKHSASLTPFCSNLYAVFLHRDMMIRGILLAAWVVQKQPIAKICLSWGDGENMYKSNDCLSKICRSLWLDSNQLESKNREQSYFTVFLRPLLVPRDLQSSITSCPCHFLFPWHNRSLNSVLYKMDLRNQSLSHLLIWHLLAQ